MSNPYREAPEEPKIPDIAWFGIRMDTGRPILERVKENPCYKCNGFGTYGNPLCGAVYTCKRCKGSGSDPVPEQIRKCYFYRLIKHEEEGSNAG